MNEQADRVTDRAQHEHEGQGNAPHVAGESDYEQLPENRDPLEELERNVGRVLSDDLTTELAKRPNNDA